MRDASGWRPPAGHLGPDAAERGHSALRWVPGASAGSPRLWSGLVVTAGASEPQQGATRRRADAGTRWGGASSRPVAWGPVSAPLRFGGATRADPGDPTDERRPQRPVLGGVPPRVGRLLPGAPLVPPPLSPGRGREHSRGSRAPCAGEREPLRTRCSVGGSGLAGWTPGTSRSRARGARRGDRGPEPSRHLEPRSHSAGAPGALGPTRPRSARHRHRARPGGGGRAQRTTTRASVSGADVEQRPAQRVSAEEGREGLK